MKHIADTKIGAAACALLFVAILALTSLTPRQRGKWFRAMFGL